VIIAFDPGRNVGVAYVSEDGRLLERAILDLGALKALDLPPDAVLVVGSGTGSRAIQDVLVKLKRAYTVVDEEGSTLEARALYFRDHPPMGLQRLLPEGLRAPDVPIDDYAAYAIALRYLRGRQAS
jgi:hypothetical protein